jgi:transposase
LSKRYTDEFKVEAVKQVLERGHGVIEVAQRLGVHKHSLYEWVRTAKKPESELIADTERERRIRRLEAELRRVTEERDILKKAAAYFAKQSG